MKRKRRKMRQRSK
uniref:Uncharacterized protein n=1 Tax=Leptobrachium leishanense TaxID=445787 RepID=A0A8C5MJH5_9ANUR